MRPKDPDRERLDGRAHRDSTRAEVEPVELVCPRPVHRPIMLQGWHNLASIHWPFDPGVVQRILPPGLTVDVCDGQAWVGLIPFHMRRIRLPGLPALGAWSSFPETNVRTYVVAPDGRRAVWFCSLDVTRIVPAAVARVAYGLPYCWADMSITHHGRDVIEYTTGRRWPHPGPRSRVVIEVGARLDDDALSGVERFVTARWALASTFAGRGVWANVDHGQWPLHRARLVECEDSLVAAAGLPRPQGDPVVLWSPGVEVRIGRPHLLRRELVESTERDPTDRQVGGGDPRDTEAHTASAGSERLDTVVGRLDAPDPPGPTGAAFEGGDLEAEVDAHRRHDLPAGAQFQGAALHRRAPNRWAPPWPRGRVDE